MALGVALAMVGAAATAASPAAGPAAHASSIDWVRPQGTDMAPIFAQAQAANKPVFLYWGAVWCPPCNQVKATVFNRPDFIERSRWFVPVYLDGDTAGAQKLGAQFKVRGYPTMILLRPDGQEITRLPGEVDANAYMEVLGLGMAAAGGVKDALQRALNAGGSSASVGDWRLLAFYAWDQDEGQVVAKAELPSTLQRLAQNCPPQHRDVANRLAFKAVVASHMEHLPVSRGKDTLERLRGVLTNPTQLRANADVLLNYAGELVGGLTEPGSGPRLDLTQRLAAALQKLAVDTQLSKLDRLGAVQAQVVLAKLDVKDQPELKAAWRAKPELLQRVQQAVRVVKGSALTPFERQALIPAAADLLSEVRLWDESDALLKAELDKAISPYYHMLMLAANARARGDVGQALAWSEKAWGAAQGNATRLQWGVGYINRLIDLAPTESARIEKAAAAVLGEVDPVPENFYERNRRGLERLGKRLVAWGAQPGERHDALSRLQTQWQTTCDKLPPQDEARSACTSVFKQE